MIKGRVARPFGLRSGVERSIPPETDPSKPSGAAVKCLRCEGTGRRTVPCEICKGRGVLVLSCRKCSGTGTYSQEAGPCQRCEASGVLRDGSPCPRCRGSRSQAAFSSACSKCAGSGSVNLPCKKCRGKLTVEANCETCAGTGLFRRKA